jgi:Tfp pilus assembly protein FimT
MALLLLFAVSGFYRLHHEWTLWGCARALESSLQWGRMHAISTNRPLLFRVDDNDQRYFWVDPETDIPFSSSIRFLARGTRFSTFPRSPLRFYQYGNAVPAGTYTIMGQAGSYSVIVAPGGRIRSQKN